MSSIEPAKGACATSVQIEPALDRSSLYSKHDLAGKPRNFSGSCSNDEGFVLVAALWILATLAMLATIYSAYLSQTSRSFAESDDRLRTEAAVNASLSLTAYRLEPGGNQTAPTHGAFQFHLGRISISTRFVNEASRIDLNKGSPELLAGLFRTLGQQPDRAKIEAGHVVAWRTPIKRGARSGEDAQYIAAGLKYGPRHGPFTDASELWLVRDLPAALVRRALNDVTIYSGAAGIDALDARLETLASLPGMTPDRLRAAEAQIASAPEDAKALAKVLGPLQNLAFNTSKAVRVFATIRLESGRKVTGEAVIAPQPSGKGYRTLAWRDDLDEPFVGLDGSLGNR